jgi:hypothetical protein
MPLRLLPDLTFPLRRDAINPLMDNVMQVNIVDAGVTENMQRALGLMLHTWDLWVKSGGRIDYRGEAGHARMIQDAMTFCPQGCGLDTRHGEIAAAHLSIDFSDTQIRLLTAKLPLLPSDPSDLLRRCRDLYPLSVEDEKRVGLLLDMLGKKPVPM